MHFKVRNDIHIFTHMLGDKTKVETLWLAPKQGHMSHSTAMKCKWCDFTVEKTYNYFFFIVSIK